MTRFFVEGHCEQNFLSEACKGGSAIRRINLNGSAVSIPQIIRQIVAIYRTMGDCEEPIVVIFDREARNQSSEDIASEVVAGLAASGIRAVAGIPDRCIETWMLYDAEDLPLKRDNYEGSMGSTELRRAFGRYDKAADGPQRLKKCRASELMRSASFKRFFDSLAISDCWWLKR